MGSDAADQVVFIRVAGDPTGKMLSDLYETLNETLPEPWGVVVLTEEVEAMDREEVNEFAEDLKRLVGEEEEEVESSTEEPEKVPKGPGGGVEGANE